MEAAQDLAVEELTSVDGFETLPTLFLSRVQEHADDVVIREKDLGIWNEYTWADYGEYASLVGYGLKALGMQRGDICSIASEINKEWMFADLGVICMGGITNGVYPTDAPNQVEYLINDSGTRFYFAEDEEQVDKVLTVRERTPSLEKLIIFDMEGLRHLDDPMCMSFEDLLTLGREFRDSNPSLLAEEAGKSQPGDIMILTYTSGTTGPPKGAMITQTNMLFMMRTIRESYGLEPGDSMLGFLPLAHVAGRMFYTFSVIESRSVVNLVEDLDTIVQDQQEVSPTVHFAVPRVWEKNFSTVSIKRKESTWLGRYIFDAALSIGDKRAAHVKNGEKVPWALAIGFRFFDFVALRNIRRLLGIDQCRWLSTAAAPVSPDLIDWYWALGIPMYEVYGQTECSGIATANMPGANRIGSVGRAVLGADVKLSEEDEILIRSPGVVLGYWNKPEKTAETIQGEWLHTGDVGRIDGDGFVYIVDRMKDIIIHGGWQEHHAQRD